MAPKDRGLDARKRKLTYPNRVQFSTASTPASNGCLFAAQSAKQFRVFNSITKEEDWV